MATKTKALKHDGKFSHDDLCKVDKRWGDPVEAKVGDKDVTIAAWRTVRNGTIKLDGQEWQAKDLKKLDGQRVWCESVDNAQASIRVYSSRRWLYLLDKSPLIVLTEDDLVVDEPDIESDIELDDSQDAGEGGDSA